MQVAKWLLKCDYEGFEHMDEYVAQCYDDLYEIDKLEELIIMANTQPKYDSLEYASELKEAGFTDQQAKVQAKALFRVIDQQLVTKQDIKELETKLSYDIKELELKTAHQMKELESQLVFRLTKIMVILLGLSISIIGLMIKFF